MKKIATLATILLASALSAQVGAFYGRGIGGGGALFSPSLNPANPNEFFVACDMSELFHATSFGNTYDQIHFTEFIGGHNSKVCYTSLSAIRYSISYINDIGTPVVSPDGGNTWSTLTGNPDPNEDVYTIHSDYLNPQRILISQYGGIFFSSNGGTSFTQIHTALTGQGNVVGGALFDGNNIYIGTNDGVLVSTNGGGNWNTATITGLPANEVIWSFCAATSSTTTRFFCLTGDPGDVYVGLQGSDYWGFFRNVYTCDYGVNNWSAASTGITQGTDFPMFIDMAENDINTVYVTGSNDVNEPIVMKSTNAGGNWSHTFLTTNNANIITGWSGDGGDRGWSYGECPFGFDVCAANSNFLLFSDFGFVHYSDDGASSWKQGYVADFDDHPAGANTPQGTAYTSIGLENTTCWQVHWSDAMNMWSCFSDIRGIRSTDGGFMWSFNYSGHTANSSYRVAEMQNGTMIMACSGVHDIYQSTRLTDAFLDANDAAGTLRYSTDNGATWNLLHSFGHPVYWVEIDPNNPNRAYASVIHYNGGAGVGGVYRCDDLNNLAGSTWTLLSDPPNTEKHPACLEVLNDGTLIATYSGRRFNNAFTSSSGVFTYDPTSGNWTDVSDPGMRYWTKDIVVDPYDSTQNTWYVGVFSGWGGPPNGLGGLYRTTDRGATWTNLTGTTLDRVTSCTFEYSSPNLMYVTTEGQGLWYCGNINTANPIFWMVTSYPFRQPERVFFNPYNLTEVWVTSFGNGMKVGNISLGIADFSQEPFNIYPNPASGSFTITGKNSDVMEILSINGTLVRSHVLREGANLISVADLAEGVYVVRRGDSTTRLVIHR